MFIPLSLFSLLLFEFSPILSCSYTTHTHSHTLARTLAHSHAHTHTGFLAHAHSHTHLRAPSKSANYCCHRVTRRKLWLCALDSILTKHICLLLVLKHQLSIFYSLSFSLSIHTQAHTLYCTPCCNQLCPIFLWLYSLFGASAENREVKVEKRKSNILIQIFPNV